jgi:hypothetical protein
VSEDSEPVPKLPRGRGFRLSGPEMFRILLTGAMLVAVLILARPCGNAVSGFLMKFDNKGSGSAAQHAGSGAIAPSMNALPGSAGDYVELHPGMTDDEVKQAIEQAKAKAKHAGSAAP